DASVNPGRLIETLDRETLLLEPRDNRGGDLLVRDGIGAAQVTMSHCASSEITRRSVARRQDNIAWSAERPQGRALAGSSAYEEPRLTTMRLHVVSACGTFPHPRRSDLANP